MEISLMLLNALMYGVLLSLGLGAVLLLSFAIAPDMWLGDYPPEVQQAYGPMSAKGRRYRPLVGILFFGTVFAIVALSFGALRDGGPADPSFVEYFLTSFVILMVFNLFDLLIVDWLIFVKIQPKRIVLPGTEGMAGYKDYGFHFRGFLVGIVFSTVGAAIITAIAFALQSITR